MSKLKIVIADNESIIRMDLKEMLEEAGHEVVGECFNGLKAIELTQRLKPDLVIMDIKMPEMDGITAAKRISDQNIIPVLTEYPKEELEDYAAGLFDRLCNPFIDHSLLAISLNTTSKWKARVLPTVREYQAATGGLPPRLTAGFAAYVMFYRGERLEENALVAHRGETEYRICDDMEVLRFFEAHKSDMPGGAGRGRVPERSLLGWGP